MKNNIDFGKYRTYDELYALLVRFSEEYPKLCKLYSIGKTFFGRDLWLMEITNYETGQIEEKAGMWVDGNTHGPEVTGSAVCLKTIFHLLSNFRVDSFVTNLLNTKSFYILPRVNPDGAELWLTKPYHTPWAGIPNPRFKDGEGLFEEDVNGDGNIVQMRIKDPNGSWKVSKKDSRLMLKRLSEDTLEKDGPFFRIITEGMFLKYKPGQKIKLAPYRFLGGSNRNYPAYWAPGGIGGMMNGPFPLWELEARAIADFWANHPNLASIHSFHTSSGVILRESTTKPDTSFIERDLHLDLAIFKEIGRIGEKVTGYPCVSIYDEFTGDVDRPYRRGTAFSFFYEHLGVFGFSIELWDWPVLLGLGGFRERGSRKFSWSKLTEEQNLKMLKWIDQEMDGKGFVNWKKFNHPQIGPVEIGGLNMKYTKRNPPEGKWLQKEVEKTFMFALKHAENLPKIEIAKTKITKFDQKSYKIEAIIENTGFIPTNITQIAIKTNIANPVIAELKIDENIEIISGDEKTNIGHLDGKSAKLLMPRVIYGEMEDETKQHTEWIIKKKKDQPSIITIIARCPKAGIDRKQIILK